MKRCREGYKFPQGNIRMTSRCENGELILIPISEDGQLLFRFYIEI